MVNNNKRNYFRLFFKHPLCAELKLIGIAGKKIESGQTKVCVLDLSAGGARFVSHLRLPESYDLLIELKVNIFLKELKLIGTIVRIKPLGDGIMEYGMKFSLGDNEASQLIHSINSLAILLRKVDTVPDCSFCTQEDLDFVYRRPTSKK